MGNKFMNADGFEQDFDFNALVRDICDRQADSLIDEYVESFCNEIFGEDEMLKLLANALEPIEAGVGG